jgi:DNA polymerase/3'-5' exonuclease PolX
MSMNFPGQVRLHRWVVWLTAKQIAKQLHIKDYVLAGSYRRGKWWCNDIDMLIPVSSIEEKDGIKARLAQLGWQKRADFFSASTFGHLLFKKVGDKVICLDVFFVLPGCMGNALLFTTGSQNFNDKIRADILSLGYSWANPPYFERIIDSSNICFSDEKAALCFLGMHWVAPKDRL